MSYLIGAILGSIIVGFAWGFLGSAVRDACRWYRDRRFRADVKRRSEEVAAKYIFQPIEEIKGGAVVYDPSDLFASVNPARQEARDRWPWTEAWAWGETRPGAYTVTSYGPQMLFSWPTVQTIMVKDGHYLNVPSPRLVAS